MEKSFCHAVSRARATLFIAELTTVYREYLLTLLESDDKLISHYAISEIDRVLVRLLRDYANRLGMTV